MNAVKKLPLMLFPPSPSAVTETSTKLEGSIKKKPRRMRGGRAAQRAAASEKRMNFKNVFDIDGILKYQSSAGASARKMNPLENSAGGGEIKPSDEISSSLLPASPAISKKYVSSWVKLGLAQKANNQNYESEICLPLPSIPEGLQNDFNTQVLAIDANNLFKAQLQSAILFK